MSFFSRLKEEKLLLPSLPLAISNIRIAISGVAMSDTAIEGIGHNCVSSNNSVEKVSNFNYNFSIHQIINTCGEFLNLARQFRVTTPSLLEAISEIADVYKALDPDKPYEKLREPITRLHNTCMWLDLSYELSVYPTFFPCSDLNNELCLAGSFEAEKAVRKKVTNVNIRRASEKDIANIENLELTYFDYPSSFKELLKYNLFVAEAHSSFAGFAALSSTTLKGNGLKVLTIESIAVVPELLRRGIGSHLLDRIYNTGINGKYDRISALVRETNRRALEYFSANGFWDSGEFNYTEVATKEKGIALVKDLNN